MEQNETFNQIRAWAKERGIYEKGDVKTQYIKLAEEFGEVGKAILKQNDLELIDGIGDCVVVLTNLAHLAGFNIEDCIQSALDEISSRKGKMINGTFVKDVTIAETTMEVEDDSEWYMCVGLEENLVGFWNEQYEIGKAYLKSEMECYLEGCVYMHINGKDSAYFCVDESQFDLMNSRYEH